MSRFCLAIVLALTCFACSPYATYVDLDATRPPAGLVLNVSAVRETKDGLDVDLELINESGQPFRYRGYSQAQPVFSYQYLTDKAWTQPILVMCGTGLTEVEIGPRERVSLNAKAYAKNRLQRIRIGVPAIDAGYAVWSPIIDPATLRTGPPRS